jgi:hypothetical protein
LSHFTLLSSRRPSPRPARYRWTLRTFSAYDTTTRPHNNPTKRYLQITRRSQVRPARSTSPSLPSTYDLLQGADAERLPHRRDELFGLFATIDSHVKFDNDSVSSEVPEAVRPRYIFISDSIIFSAPLLHGTYDGLAILVAKSIQIAHKVLETGYLLRGALSVGSAWHTATNIFGTAYIDAWQTQDGLEDPKVVPTAAAREHWTANLQSVVGNLCLPDENGALIVDTLDPYYIRGKEIHGREEQAFREYQVTNQARLSTLPSGGSAHRKWQWMDAFMRRAIERHRIGV